MARLSPAQAVEMQKKGAAITEIAEALGTTHQQIGVFFREMSYDPVAYHAEAVIAAYDAGESLGSVCSVCGYGTNSPTGRRLISALLQQRGIPVRSQAEQHKLSSQLPPWNHRRKIENDEAICPSCEIICQAAELAEHGHCAWCEEIARGGSLFGKTDFQLMCEEMRDAR